MNCGFHVTQVNLIITQVKNKIAYHSINRVKECKYRRKVINKQRAKVSGMCDVANSSYSVLYEDALLEPPWGTPTWWPEISLNMWSLLWLSLKTFTHSVIRIGTSLNILATQNSKTIRQLGESKISYTFLHVTRKQSRCHAF